MNSHTQLPKQQKITRNPRTVSTKSVLTKSTCASDGDQFTVPKVKYEYKIVPWEVFLDNTYTGYKSVRSSFIPYVFINNEKYWLLGSFHDFPKDILMDFGGSCILWDPPRQYAQGKHQEKHYQHQFGCAMLLSLIHI